MRTTAIAGTAIAVLALGGALSACGTYSAATAAAGGHQASPSPSPSGSVTSPPTPAPHTTVIKLGAAFSPDRLTLGVGGQFLVMVSPSVHATILGTPAGCAPGAAATTTGYPLSVRCTSGGYLYTAERPGSAVISATAGPRCSPGQMCPQWLSAPRLSVTIT